ncbi:MAG: copper resistance D family protein [Nocardioides sp.]
MTTLSAPVRTRHLRTPPVVLVLVAAATSVVAALSQPGHTSVDLAVLLLLGTGALVKVAAAGTIGCLLVSLCHAGRHGPPPAALLVTSSQSAGLWAMGLGVALVVEMSWPAAVAAHGVVGPDAADVSARFRWLVVGVVLVGLVHVLACTARTVRDVYAVLGVAVAGLVVGTGTGHVGSMLEPSAASLALVVHVLAATAWIGGLLAIVMHSRVLWADGADARTLHAYSQVALACYLSLAVSGVLGLAARTSLAALLDSSAYLMLVTAKLAILVVLGAVGARQRRVWLPRVERGGSRAFLVLAVGELVLMATATGLAVTLTHTAS